MSEWYYGNFVLSRKNSGKTTIFSYFSDIYVKINVKGR